MKRLIIILFLLWPCIVSATDEFEEEKKMFNALETLAQHFCESDRDARLLMRYSFYRFYMFQLPEYCSQKGVFFKSPQKIMHKYSNQFVSLLQDVKNIKCNKDFLRGALSSKFNENSFNELKLQSIRYLKNDYQSTDDDLAKYKDLVSDDIICEVMDTDSTYFENVIKKYIVDMY